MEDTKIPGDVLKGLISLSSHGEIMNNPFLRSNRPLQSKIEEDFRKSVILAVDEELTKRVAETQEYDKLPTKDRDRVAKDQQKFAALAQGYKSALGKHDRGEEIPMTPVKPRTPYSSSADSARRERYRPQRLIQDPSTAATDL